MVDAPPAPPAVPSHARLWRLGLAAVSMFFFMRACSLPAINLTNGIVWSGVDVLFMGPLGIFFLQFAWFANTLYLVSLLFVILGWRIAAVVVAMLQVFIAMDMFAFPGAVIYLDEAAVNKATVVGYSAGAWYWLAAMIAPIAVVMLPRAAQAIETNR